jgi:hypothetical protein
VRLTSNILILDKLTAFPFQLFVLEPLPFWELVVVNFFDISVMIIWRVSLDTDADAITLRRLKNGVMQNLQREEYLSELRQVLRTVNFERGMSELEPQVRAIRNKALAHATMPPNERSNLPRRPAPSISLSELVGLQQKLHSLFQTLCFGRGRAVYPLPYHPDITLPAGVDSRLDIERLLDCVAKESPVLNMPEQQPQHWALWRSNLSPESLETLNLYRRRFGLGPA